ncbi:MAG: hypothetical protein JRI68_23360 [Deltaproteobacteria bacterium]|nr:hypothetical protein [Deltaproteobacteria bacterium]
MGIHEVLIAPRSPWQSPYVERVIGTLRRDLLDHVIVVGEEHLRRLLRNAANRVTAALRPPSYEAHRAISLDGDTTEWPNRRHSEMDRLRGG